MKIIPKKYLELYLSWGYILIDEYTQEYPDPQIETYEYCVIEEMKEN